MSDFLDEDSVINSQRYAIMSYILPNKPNEDKKGKKPEFVGSPMVKFRGAYATVDDCHNRIVKLQKEDKYFNMYIIEVGKWGALLTDEQIKEDKDLESIFQENKLNEMFMEHKASKDKADREFAERTEWLKQKAAEDGTREGQARLAGKKENPISVKNRIEDSEFRIKQLNSQLEELEKVYEEAKEKIKDYSDEELEAAQKELEKLTIAN